MESSIKKLQSVFKLESSRGYDNGAVMGGLEKLLDTWEAEARADGLDEDLIKAINSRLRDYSRLSPKSREETLKGLWRRIKRSRIELQEELEKPQPPAARPSPEVSPEPASQQPSPEPIEPEQPEPAPKLSLIPVEETPPRSLLVLKPHTSALQVTEAQPDSVPTPKPERVDTTPVEQKEEEPAALDAPVTVLPGVGERHARTLSRLGLETLGDMLYHFPRRYDDYTKIEPINRLWYGQEVTIIATVQSISSRRIHNKRLQMVEAIISDGTGTMRVTWFNQPWLTKKLRSGTHVVLSGKIDQYLGRLTMNNPEWEMLEREHLHTNRIVPIYPLTARLTQRWMRRIMFKVVKYWAPRVQDHLPDTIRKEAGLIPLSEALLQIHFPVSWEALKKARYRLAFDEIFLLQMGVLRQKQSWQELTARKFETPEDWLQARKQELPFELTSAQDQALADVRRDLAAGHPMNRLLQGDVGSGKTVIAALGIAMIARHGAQSALMAPTSILAEQHYQNLSRILIRNGADFQEGQIRLMVGATPESEKEEIRQGLATGYIKLVIGTHALIESPVQFQDLEFVIIDEQHRFGVQQRSLLRQKGTNPHLLVMTATPIPRSLALTVYGDLDLSVMDEMPPGRLPVETHVVFPRERERAYTLINREVDGGNQAFIIYPLVEESEKSEAKAAVEEHQRLEADVFPKYQVGLLHGRMKPAEKEAVMTQFRDKDYQVLVSTSVVEVGVDIPDATIMMIEGANRFGLAQLHQFRGRVGRGTERSYCLLIPETDEAAENERLSAMAETNDGFVLAERDLEQRGPGDFLGTRQSGFIELRLAQLTDVRLIEKARRAAQNLFERDPELQDPENALLPGALENFWETGAGDIS